MNRDQFKLANDVVRKLVHQWDPYSLLEGGSPNDEFDSEISTIVSKISSIQSESDATKVVSNVFSSAFEPALFTEEMCNSYGRDLFAGLKEKGLLNLTGQLPH